MAIRNLPSLLQKRFVQTSATLFSPTSPLPRPTPRDSTVAVEFLVNSCGLPIKSAISASKKFPFDEKRPEKHQSVLDFLRSQGFSQTQIAKLIEKQPRFLQSTAEKSLKPKFDFFQENGFVGEFLLELIVKSPPVIRMSLDSNLRPKLQLLKSYVASNENIMAAVWKSPWLLTCNLKEKIDFLTKEGVPPSRIGKLLVSHPRTLLVSHNRMAHTITVVKDLGIEPTSPKFIHALRLFMQNSESTLEKKKEVLRSLGWSTEEILSTFKTYPFCLSMSEENIRKTMDFFVHTLKWDAQSIVSRPLLLGFGLDTRLRPRYDVLKILESKGLLKRKINDRELYTLSNKMFLDKYVIRNEDKVPGLMSVFFVLKKTEKIDP